MNRTEVEDAGWNESSDYQGKKDEEPRSFVEIAGVEPQQSGHSRHRADARLVRPPPSLRGFREATVPQSPLVLQFSDLRLLENLSGPEDFFLENSRLPIE